MTALLRALCATLTAFTLQCAAFADEATVIKTFRERFPGMQVESVSKTPIAGLYEVYGDGRIFYADDEVNHVIQGILVDAKTRRNLTDERLTVLTVIPFDQLPLDLAIKIVKGDGKRSVAVFEDPDCPFCQQLEQQLVKVDNVTVYVFLYPIEQLHPGASDKSRKVWCAPDPAQAWLDAVLRKSVPAAAPAACADPLAKIAQFVRTHRITGTPTLVFADGRRATGAISADQIDQILNATTVARAEASKEP